MWIKGVAAERKAPENMEQMTRGEIWKGAISIMEESMVSMDEEQKVAYEQKIRQKMKSGRKLTAEEMNYLRLYHPDLYRSAMRVETSRKILRTKLKSCKSKEEVQNVISVQNEVLKAMEGDPDREYMAAMVKHEVEEFQKSSVYARLPETIEKGQKRKKQAVSEQEIWKDEEGKTAIASNTVSVLGQMQIQCIQISQMAETFSA